MMTRRGRIALVAGAAALVGAAFAGVRYYGYASAWLRPPGRVSRCAMLARRALQHPIAASGTEPHDDVDGQTVYLTGPEDIAVRCAGGIDRMLAQRFTSAFAEPEPERRALELLRILRDVDASQAQDDRATLVYVIGSGALDGLPELPEVRAARDEFGLLHACRFSTRNACPTRPPIPPVVLWVGAPSGLVILGLLGIPIAAAVRRLVARRRIPRTAARPGADCSPTLTN